MSVRCLSYEKSLYTQKYMAVLQTHKTLSTVINTLHLHQYSSSKTKVLIFLGSEWILSHS